MSVRRLLVPFIACGFFACVADTVGIEGLPEAGACAREDGCEPAAVLDPPGEECRIAADCVVGSGASLLCDRYGTTAQATCLDGRCISHCAAARTCRVQGELACLQCTAGDVVTTSCREAGAPCDFRTVQSLDIEMATCNHFPDRGYSLSDLRVTFAGNTGTCSFEGYVAAGVDPFGKLQQLPDYTIIADVPGYGGTCLGAWLPTDAPRWVLSCPDCTIAFGP